MSSSAPTLNLSADRATATVPDALAPEGITCLSPTITGLATEAVKRSPALFIFELMGWLIAISMTVPGSRGSTLTAVFAGAGLIVFFWSLPATSELSSGLLVDCNLATLAQLQRVDRNTMVAVHRIQASFIIPPLHELVLGGR